VANDTVGNFFFRNLTLGPGGEAGEPGRFVEEGTELGLAYDRMGTATGAMGVDAGYLRNDADMGYLIGNFANEMTSVYIAQGDTTLYADEAIASGLGAPSRTRLTFGILLTDADLDGRLDVVQTNGHLENEIAQVDPSQTFEQSAQLFWNAGSDAPRTFVAVADEELGDLTRPLVGRGSAAADLDGDGDEDLVMTQIEGPPLVLRNDQATGHHWLRVRLLGHPEEGNRDALGAWIEVTADGITQRRPVMPVKSYLSQSALPVTFGLGAATRVDSLVVVWPDGTREEREITVIDQEIAVPR
jgi:enediyne biosynthesis protein E4